MHDKSHAEEDAMSRKDKDMANENKTATEAAPTEKRRNGRADWIANVMGAELGDKTPVVAVIDGDRESGKTLLMQKLRMTLESLYGEDVYCIDDVSSRNVGAVADELAAMQQGLPIESMFGCLSTAPKFAIVVIAGSQPAGLMVDAIRLLRLSSVHAHLSEETIFCERLPGHIERHWRDCEHAAKRPAVRKERASDEVLSSFMEFADRHHLAERIDDIPFDYAPTSDGKRFVIALGETLALVLSMHESGDLGDEWPQADRLVTALLAMAHND